MSQTLKGIRKKKRPNILGISDSSLDKNLKDESELTEEEKEELEKKPINKERPLSSKFLKKWKKKIQEEL